MSPDRRTLLGAVLVALGVGGASQFHGQWQESQLGRQMAQAAGVGDIRMLASQTCAYCVLARAWLQRNGVVFSECLIETDAACAAEYRAHGGPGTPLLIVRGQPQLGFDPQRVVDRLATTRS